MTGRISTAIILSAVFAGCCQTAPAVAGPAVLARGDDADMARVRAALEKEMGRSPLELGPGDLTQGSTVSVLPLPPGPLEDRSLATPTIFRLEIENGSCLFVREDTGARIPLEGVECRAAG